MITVLVGHRGVGKSSLLTRIKVYRPDSLVLDLDAEMAEGEQRSLEELFAAGEANFRALETRYLSDILTRFHEDKSTDVFIAVGAGFSGEIPPWVHVVWIRRENDGQGRI